MWDLQPPRHISTLPVNDPDSYNAYRPGVCAMTFLLCTPKWFLQRGRTMPICRSSRGIIFAYDQSGVRYAQPKSAGFGADAQRSGNLANGESFLVEVSRLL